MEVSKETIDTLAKAFYAGDNATVTRIIVSLESRANNEFVEVQKQKAISQQEAQTKAIKEQGVKEYLELQQNNVKTPKDEGKK